MSSNFDRLYKVVNGNNLGSADFWNQRFQDIDIRLGSAEGQFGRIDAAIDTVINAGVDRINNTLQPAIDNLSAQVQALGSDVADLSGQVISDQNNLTEQLNALLAEGQAAVNNLETLGTVDGGTF